MSAIERLLEALDSQIDAALIVSDANRFYFTGFPSSAGTLLITREQSYFIVDFRYIEIAKKTIQNCEVILQGNLTEQLNELIARHQVRTLGIEAATLSLAAYQRFAETLCLPTAASPMRLRRFAPLRRRKSRMPCAVRRS